MGQVINGDDNLRETQIAGQASTQEPPHLSLQIALVLLATGSGSRRPTDGEGIPLAHAVTLPQRPHQCALTA
jgi:hypothetical protein